MAKGFAIHNAPTDHGGFIPSTQVRSSQQGNLFVRAGDGHFCPKCKVWSTVQPSHNHIIFDGKPVAYVNDMLSCGARIQPQQFHVVGDSGGGNYRSNTVSALEPIQSQQSLTNNLSSQEKYENYYIERNKTEYIKFRNAIFPYDDDRKGLFGVVSQGISGACDYIVTYVVRGEELFVSISFIPPILKHDAEIFPSASLKVYKESNSKFEFIQHVNLIKEAGFWDADKGKEPVGSCTVKLPEPDLSIIKIILEMGYEAKLDGGIIFPNPRFVTHTFTLNSAARKMK